MQPKTPPEILVLSPESYHQLGGLSLYLRQVVSALDRYGTVTFLGRSRSAPASPPSDDLPSLRRAPRSAASRRAQIWQAIAWGLGCRLSRRPAFTLCGHLYLAPLARWVQRLAGGRSLLVLLGIESWQSPPRMVARRCASHFDLYASVSQTTAEHFCRWSDILEERITVVPPFVDPAPFQEITRRDVTRLRARLGLGDRPTLLTVARLDEAPRRKGHHHVLRLLPTLQERHPGLAYLIVGEGPGRPQLERQIASLEMSDSVFLLGAVSEKDKAILYRLANAFVLASDGEGFGIALAEAAMSRQPIVYSRLDASSEAVAQADRRWAADPSLSSELLEALDAALRSGRTSPAVDHPVQALPNCTIEVFERSWQQLLRYSTEPSDARPNKGS